VAIVARFLSRARDGRRLLQFLTGLALVALSFVIRVDGPATTVGAAIDRPAAASAVDAGPAAPPAADAALAVAPDSAVAPDPADASATSAQDTPSAADAGLAVRAPGITAEHTGADGTPAGIDATPTAGSTPASHGSRAPPLA
jgi:hypothetical protein